MKSLTESCVTSWILVKRRLESVCFSMFGLATWHFWAIHVHRTPRKHIHESKCGGRRTSCNMRARICVAFCVHNKIRSLPPLHQLFKNMDTCTYVHICAHAHIHHTCAHTLAHILILPLPPPYHHPEIRSWWEVPCVAHFCHIFQKPLKLPDIEIEVS